MTLRLGLLTSAAVAMAREDPALLAAQVSRRYLGAATRRGLGQVGAHLPAGALRETCALLADRSDLLTETGTRGLHALSREAWDLGRVEDALGMLDDRDPFFERLNDEWRILDGGRMHLRRVDRAGGAGPSGSAHSLDVLHFLNNSPPHTQSGYTVRTQRLLAAQRSAGMRVAAATRVGYPVITGWWNVPDASVVDGVEYHRLLPRSLRRMPRQRLAQQALELQALALRLRPRVLHTTTDFRNALTVEAVARSLNVPWVYEMRGQLERTWLARHAPELQDAVVASTRYRAWRDAETAMARRADAVLVLSETQKADMVARGVAPERMTVIPNAFDWPEDQRRVGKARARAALGLAPDRIWIGSVSAVVDYEGFDTLVRAVALLRQRGHDVGAVIAGDGVHLPTVRRLARESGVGDVVVLPGKVSLGESHLWYEALDLFAVPRRDTPVCHTVTPIKPLEAMALGTPLIVSDLPALRELIGPDAGLAVAPDDPRGWADAVAALHPLSSRYATMARAARSRAARTSWTSNARACGDVYARILR